MDETDSDEEFHKPSQSSQPVTDINIMMKSSTKRPIEEDTQKITLKLPQKKSKPSREEIMKKRIKDSLNIHPTHIQTSSSESSAEPTLLTEDDIVQVLRSGPMRTKDLIAKLKPKLTKDAKNKELFASLVKKVAVMKADDKEKEKMLELRDSYK